MTVFAIAFGVLSGLYMAIDFVRYRRRFEEVDRNYRGLKGDYDYLWDKLQAIKNQHQPPKKALSQAEYNFLVESGMDEWTIAEKYILPPITNISGGKRFWPNEQ